MGIGTETPKSFLSNACGPAFLTLWGQLSLTAEDTQGVTGGTAQVQLPKVGTFVLEKTLKLRLVTTMTLSQARTGWAAWRG